MQEYQSIIEIIALSMGVAWASGINLYAVLLVLGIGGATGNIALPENLEVLANPMVIGAAGLMYLVEFGVDKTPGADSVWDGLHSFIRLPAGALLAGGMVGEVEPAMMLAAAIVGGGVSATSHFSKASTRLLINTSPEPVSNWTASLTEDIAVLGGLWLALNHPLVFLAALVVFVGLAIWLLPKMWRLILQLFERLKNFLSGNRETPQDNSIEPPTTLDPNLLADRNSR